MHENKAFIRPQQVGAVIDALHKLFDMPGITVSSNVGYGRSSRPDNGTFAETEVAKIEPVVPDPLVASVIEVIQRAAATGRPCDGKIFMTRVEQAIRIRSGESGAAVL